MKKQGLAVNLLIVRNQKILLVKRSEFEKDFRGYWSIPWGSVDFWETVYQALQREIREELSVEIKTSKLFDIFTYRVNPELCFYATYFIGDIMWEPVLDQEELAEYRRFNLDDELLKLDLAFNQKEVIAELLERKPYKKLDLQRN